MEKKKIEGINEEKGIMIKKRGSEIGSGDEGDMKSKYMCCSLQSESVILVIRSD